MAAAGRMRRVDEAVRQVLADAIAEELKLRRTPTLEFRYDETTDRAMQIEALLRERGDLA